ncbi:MAG: zinc-dependent metalloprotease, partial [Gemmatimonadales bacterium]
STAASGEAVTLRVHHSLVQLPDDQYRPRNWDPRVGAGPLRFANYASSIDEPLSVGWIRRHRLVKRDPDAARSEPVEPIVYYVDRGTPEPIRTALVEGAMWWADAFDAAGFINAFRVELLPADADPMDLRYNMIHWTHRSTRGWSYGSSVVDPRTGEIIKGNVNLGSLRLKQDFMLAEGLAPAGDASCDFCGGPVPDYLARISQEDPVELALARVRQLSAHEVGHTLGFAHNYIASTYGRASVMDYPAPLVQIRDGQLDLSEAYAVGIGAYDEFAVVWAYSQFPAGTDEHAALDSIVSDGIERGIRFLSDQDARPAGAAHPLAALWDNGSDPIDMLRHEMEVRRIGMENFSDRVIEEGEPLASLEEVLVPLYFHHRYQVEAAAKSIGGADYTYALRGDGQRPIAIVPAATQRAALDAVLATVSPAALAIPERLLQLIPPRAFGMAGSETFPRRTGATFDPLAAAGAAAEHSLRFVLHPQRMARLVEFHSRDNDLPSLEEVLDRMVEVIWEARAPRDSHVRLVGEVVQRVLVDLLMAQAQNESNTAQVRAILTAKIRELAALLGNRDRSPHVGLVIDDIERWLTRPEGITEPSEVPAPPPGSPIGRP